MEKGKKVIEPDAVNANVNVDINVNPRTSKGGGGGSNGPPIGFSGLKFEAFKQSNFKKTFSTCSLISERIF